jgi:hypothetical protein
MPTFDSTWLDVNSQYLQDPKEQEAYSISIGNMPHLENWNTVLLRTKLNIRQPYWYNRHTTASFPLYHFRSGPPVCQKYKFNLSIKSLLRMQKKDENGWQDLPFADFKYLEKGTPEKIPIPDLRAKYSELDPDEIENEKCTTRHVIYTETVVAANSNNPIGYGETAEIALGCGGPCRALFWVAQNAHERSCHNFSNYTTNKVVYDGWNPVGSSSLKYGDNIFKFKDLKPDQMLDESMDFPRCPSDPGYNAYSFTVDPVSLDREVGVVFSTDMGAKLVCKMKNTDPFREVNLPKDFGATSAVVEGPKFYLMCRMLVSKKIVIDTSQDNIEVYYI